MARPLPVATAITSLVCAVIVAFAPGFEQFPTARPSGWPGVVLFIALVGFAAVCLARAAGRQLHAALVSLRRAVSARPTIDELAVSTGTVVRGSTTPAGAGGHQLRHRRRTATIAIALAALVTLEGVAFAGSSSPSWATSRPVLDTDLITADGHVLWLDGLPVQNDARRFVGDADVFAGGDGMLIDFRFPYGLELPGRAAYSLLVSLLVPYTARLGSTYAAFWLVNVTLWWLACLAMWDLGRLVTGRDASGLLASLLTAGGLGFTFMVGNPMSNLASYAAIPIVLWLFERLRCFDARTPLTVAAACGCLAGACGLLYDFSPLFLLIVALYYGYRGSASRLALWIIAALVSGLVWLQLARWQLQGRLPAFFVGIASNRLQPFGVAALVAIAITAAVVVGLRAWRWRSPWHRERRKLAALLATAVVGGASGAVVYLLLRGGLSARAVAFALELPAHVTASYLDSPQAAAQVAMPDGTLVVRILAQSHLEANLLAAFPAPLLVAAAFGLWQLSESRREWCVAVACAAGLMSFAMIALSHAPYPRLVFWAFPAVCISAGHGLAKGYDALWWLAHWAVRIGAGERTIRLVAAAVIVALVVVMLRPSFTPLFGDWTDAYRFHYLEVP